MGRGKEGTFRIGMWVWETQGQHHVHPSSQWAGVCAHESPQPPHDVKRETAEEKEGMIGDWNMLVALFITSQPVQVTSHNSPWPPPSSLYASPSSNSFPHSPPLPPQLGREHSLIFPAAHLDFPRASAGRW